jgi:hypothetical protein
MAKDVEVGGIVSPANLWGKPLPKKTLHKTAKKEEKDTRMLPEVLQRYQLGRRRGT